MESLGKIAQRFRRARSHIDRLVAHALRVRASDFLHFDALINSAIILLHDQWNARCRELVIKSSLGGYRTIRGSTIPKAPTVRTAVDPLKFLRSNWTVRPGNNMQPSWEPDWHVPATSIRAADKLQIANYTTVANALGAISIIDDLRWTRNAVAHKLPHTMGLFKGVQLRLLGRTIRYPSMLPTERQGVTGPLLIDAWMNDIETCLILAAG